MRFFVTLLLVLFGTSFTWADNLSSEGFQSLRLNNQIPVEFKANSNNKVLALQVFFRGGSTLMTPETAGWESLALTMLTRGSDKFSYAQLKDLQWRTSSSLSASASSFDSSSFGLVSLPSSFPQLFEAWSDGLLHPRWDQTEFNRVLQEAKIRLQQQQQDPFSRAVDELHNGMFVGHPYEAAFSPTALSLSKVTLDGLRLWWEARAKTGRMSVVAVGDFGINDLMKRLNSTLGALPVTPWEADSVPRWTTPDKAFVVPFADAGDVGYVRADFAAPAVGTPDADALGLGMTVLNDILFDVVRAKYGACYSVWGRYYGFSAPYASLIVYKTDQPQAVKAYLEEAIGLLAGGQALASQASASAAGKGGIGAAAEPTRAAYVPLQQVIEFYKAKSINSFYEGQQTNSALASQMAASLLYRGDARAYLDYAERIRAVSADDVVRVIRQYVQNSPKAWVVLAAPDALVGLSPEKFLANQPGVAKP